MKHSTRFIASTVFCAAALPLVLAPAAMAGEGGGGCTVERVTPTYQPGMPGEVGDMLGAMGVSDDGTVIALSSYSTYFLPNADALQGHIRQVVVRDTSNGDTQWELISRSFKPGDTAGANANCYPNVALSANGRYVVYASNASNLVPGVTGEHQQVYLFDRETQTTHLVSRSMHEPMGANGHSGDERFGVSNDGRVVFASQATNLTEDPTFGVWQVFMFDVNTGAMRLISRHNNGEVANMHSNNPAISADGTVATFRSFNLVDGLNWLNAPNLYLRNLNTDETEIISLHQSGVDLAGNCRFSDLSNDGRYVLFNYYHNYTHSPLDPTMDSTSGDALFVRDRQTGQVTGISRAWNNNVAVPGPEHNWSISADGQYVVWDCQGEPVTKGGPVGRHLYRTHISDVFNQELVTTHPWCEPLKMVADGPIWNVMTGDATRVLYFSNRDVMMDGTWDGMYHMYARQFDVEPSNPADLNQDGVVDVADLLLLLGNWGECQPGDTCLGDFNGDNIIDVADLLELLGQWG